MARKKRRAAKGGVKAGARVAPVAGRTAGKAAWKLGKAEAKLIRRAMSAQESKKSRYLKYTIFTLIGLDRAPRPRPRQPGRRAGPDLGQRRPGRDGRRRWPAGSGRRQPHRRRARLLGSLLR